MRNTLSICLVGAVLAACSSSVPDSGNTVYLQPLSSAERSAREAELQGQQVPLTGPASTATVATAPTVTDPSQLTNDTTYVGGPVATPTAPQAAATYEIVAPEPVPSRATTDGPSIVSYALSTTHPVGQQVYQRDSASAERSARACARYVSPDLAQAAFLSAGGPQNDSRGLDPDGDGFACTWNPEPFRQAIR
mgnify:CR=1 FL=1